jgi:hypothetical protein
MFVGVLYNRCRMTPEPVNGVWEIDLDINRVCSMVNSGGNFECPADRYCGHPLQFGISLEQDGVPESQLINYGITTFDNLGAGMLTIFQVITLEGWTGIMYNVSVTLTAANGCNYGTRFSSLLLHDCHFWFILPP